MPYPSYRLNPGDMFQVDPEMVLLGTGRQKTDADADAGKRKKKKAKSASGEEAEEAAAEPAEEEEQASESAPAAYQDPDTTDVAEPEKADLAPTRRQIQDLIERAKEVVYESELGVAQKRKLREFARQARTLLSRAGKQSASAPDIANELSGMMADLKLSSAASAEPAGGDQDSSGRNEELSRDERRILERLIREDEENPYDPSKPYRTPWQPRPYMSPFAFIPRYLEVNPNICAAVYLRHPVARVGNAEVPTPFNNEISQLAFNWYLRRR